MSYAVGGNNANKPRPGAYSRITEDEENLVNPLLGANAKK